MRFKGPRESFDIPVYFILKKFKKIFCDFLIFSRYDIVFDAYDLELI
jgi:hypothetical protein